MSRVKNSPQGKKNDEQINATGQEVAPTVEEIAEGFEELKSRVKNIEEREGDKESIELTEEEAKSLGVNDEGHLDELLGNIEQEATQAVSELDEVKQMAENTEDKNSEEIAEELVESATKSMKKIFAKARAIRRKSRIKSGDYTAEITPDMVVGAIVEEVEELIAEVAADVDQAKNSDDETEQKNDIGSVDSIDKVEEKQKGLKYTPKKKSANRRDHSSILTKAGFGAYFKGDNFAKNSLDSETIREALPTFAYDLFFKAKGNIDKAIAYRKSQDDKRIRNAAGIKDIHRLYKSMNVSNNSEGGFLVAPVYSDELIKYITDQTILDQLKYTTIDMWQGNITIPKQLNGASAHFVGERRSGKSSRPDFGTVQLSAKTLLSRFIVTQDMLQMSQYDLERSFFEDLTSAMAVEIEKAVLGGSGRRWTPQGILTHDDISIIDAKQVASKAPEFIDDNGYINGDFMTYLKKRLAKTKLSPRKDLKLVIDQDMYEVLYNQKTPGGGDYINRAAMDNGTIAGISYIVSELLGEFQSDDPTDRGIMIYGDWRQLYVGETHKIESKVLDQAFVMDESGNSVNLAEERSVATELMYQFDCNLARGENFIVVKNLKISNAALD